MENLQKYETHESKIKNLKSKSYYISGTVKQSSQSYSNKHSKVEKSMTPGTIQRVNLLRLKRPKLSKITSLHHAYRFRQRNKLPEYQTTISTSIRTRTRKRNLSLCLDLRLKSHVRMFKSPHLVWMSHSKHQVH